MLFVPALQDTSFVRSTADADTYANMTNLAIKGIVGVQAMAEISKALGQNSDAEYYGVCFSK